MPDMASTDEQRERLMRLLVVAGEPETSGDCTYGEMLFIDRPWDVCFLAPINPAMRGVEIVSASPLNVDGRDYDIWRNGRMIKPNLTAREVVTWLKKEGSLPDAEWYEHAAEWTTAALEFYKVKMNLKELL